MRWILLMVLVGCGDDFKETLSIHVDEATSVTFGGKTYTNDLEVDRAFGSLNDAQSARIPVTIRFPDGRDVDRFIGTDCGSLPLDTRLDAPSYVSSFCSYYLVTHTDDPTGDGSPGMNFDCTCTDSDGKAYGNDSADPPTF